MSHPFWATKFKKKGTELRCIRGKFYLYECHSVWDKQKNKPKKITGKCLGSISEENGFKPSKNRFDTTALELPLNPKVFGAFYLFQALSIDWIKPLKKYFPDYWKQIICIVYSRLFKKSPIKNMNFFYEQSFYSEYFKDIAFSDKTISKILSNIGQNEGFTEAFMREFISDEQFVMIDATPIFTKSRNINEARLGYNNKKQWDTQVNLLYLYSSASSMPIFYKLSPGDIREVKTFEIALLSAGIKDVIIVGDKGFTSRLNLDIIEFNELHYILPLRRNDSFIDYSDVKISKSTEKKYFKFKDRYIWYAEKSIDDNRRVTIFLDEQLRVSEEQDYLNRIEKHPEQYTIEGFAEKQITMGTIAIIDNLPKKSPKEIYQTYKSRCEIEQMFDVFKNELQADKTYMHSIESLRGWMFINHLAIVAYYKLYIMLQKSSLLDKYSVKDLLEHLYHISIMKIGNDWRLSKISTKSEKLLAKINISLPITWKWES